MQENCAQLNQTHLAHVNLKFDQKGSLQLNIQSVPIRNVDNQNMKNLSHSFTIPGTDNIDSSQSNKLNNNVSSPIISQSPISNKNVLQFSDDGENKENIKSSQCLRTPVSYPSSNERSIEEKENDKGGCKIFSIFSKKSSQKSPTSSKQSKELRTSNIITSQLDHNDGEKLITEDLQQVQNIQDSPNQQSTNQLLSENAYPFPQQQEIQSPMTQQTNIFTFQQQISPSQNIKTMPRETATHINNYRSSNIESSLMQQNHQEKSLQQQPLIQNSENLQEQQQINQTIYLDENNSWTSIDPLVKALLNALQLKISKSRRLVKTLYEKVEQQVVYLAQNKLQVLKNYLIMMNIAQIYKIVENSMLNWHEDIEVRNGDQLKASLFLSTFSEYWALMIAQIYFPLEQLSNNLIISIFDACKPETIGYIDFRGINSFIAIQIVQHDQNTENNSENQDLIDCKIIKQINPTEEQFSKIGNSLQHSLCDVILSSDKLPQQIFNLRIRRLILCHNNFEKVGFIHLKAPEELESASLCFGKIKNIHDCKNLQAIACYGSYMETDTDLPALKRFTCYDATII